MWNNGYTRILGFAQTTTDCRLNIQTSLIYGTQLNSLSFLMFWLSHVQMWPACIWKQVCFNLHRPQAPHCLSTARTAHIHSGGTMWLAGSLHTPSCSTTQCSWGGLTSTKHVGRKTPSGSLLLELELWCFHISRWQMVYDFCLKWLEIGS